MSETLYIVNAFTSNGKHGNPAGVMLGADSLSEQRMLAIAAKAGLSEVAFVSESSQATIKVRFFTPVVEEPLCGHATIATWSLLYTLGIVLAGTYTQETKAGMLEVTIENDGLTFMQQAEAVFFDEVEPTNIMDLLGIEVSDFHATLRPHIVSTGIKDLLVPLINGYILARLRPNFEAITTFSKHHDISGLHVFALLNEGSSLASARNFAPADGIPEECATGTSNGALLSFLRDKGLLPDKHMYRIEQGRAMGQLSYIYGTFKDNRVWIGGESVVVKSR
jgi:PhzF family phenazine biosynthesis protein